MFITVLTSASHLSLSWANSIQSSQPPPTSWRSILILSSHLRLGLPNDLFPSGFPTRNLYTPLPCPIRATCPTYLILLDFTTCTIFGKENRSLCNFLHSPVTSSFLGPNTLLNTLFSNNLSLHSSLNVSDQVSHPYRRTGNIIVLYILIFNFLDSKLEDKRLLLLLLTAIELSLGGSRNTPVQTERIRINVYKRNKFCKRRDF